MEVLKAGRSLLLHETHQTKRHLWFVLTSPSEALPRIVAVMVRTRKRYTDDTVVLVPGDHPFIHHESAVHFSSARWFEIESLRRAFGDGQCALLEDMAPELLRRVQAALLASPFTVNAMRDHCRACF